MQVKGPAPATILGDFVTYSKQGHIHKAVQFLQKIEEDGYQQSSFTNVCLIQGCIQLNSLKSGRLLHEQILKNEWQPNIFVSTALVNMYARCGNLEDAQVAFNRMSRRNLVTWNMMIGAYCHHERFDKALSAFWKMQEDGLVPDDVSYLSVLKACAALGNLCQGWKIHDLFKEKKMKLNTLVGNSFMNMFMKCGQLQRARHIFDSMDEKNVSSWNVIIGGYAKNDSAEESMRLFSVMRLMGVKPDEVTFLTVLNACASLRDLQQAKAIHHDMKKSDVKLNILVWNTIIDMYAKCGSLQDAMEMFCETPERDVSTWNTMIGGLTKHGHSEESLQFQLQMVNEGFYPNYVSYVGILDACAALEDVERGKQVHCRIAVTGTLNIFVQNALVDMYSKCGDLTHSCQVFYQMKMHNVISWNTLIVGHVKGGLNEDVLELFLKMDLEGVKADEITYLSLINACAALACLEEGLKVHNSIVLGRYEFDLYLGNALIDMYAKCGKIKEAKNLLERMTERDIVSWNTMLVGYAQHGCAQKVLQLVDEMQHHGMTLNHISFVSILTACSHAGLLDEAWYYFVSMTQAHGVNRAVEHYGCMVDLLSRAGCLHEAEGLLLSMSIESSAVLWRTLLGACGIHGCFELGMRAVEHILDLEPKDYAVFLLVSRAYASADSFIHDE